MSDIPHEISAIIFATRSTTGVEQRSLRKTLGLNQQELADYFQCSAQTIARYEKEQIKAPRSHDIVLRLLVLEKFEVVEYDAAKVLKNASYNDFADLFLR